MVKLASALREEIRGAAGRELSRALAPLARIERDMKVLIGILRRRRTAERAAPAGRPNGRRASAPSVRPAEVRTMRRRLRMKRPQFARLAGVSTWTVFMWEHGKVAPSPESANRLREIGKLSPAAAQAASAKPRARRGPGRPRGRS